MTETISPWLIYWVMQADSIISLFTFMGIMGVGAIGIIGVLALVTEGETWKGSKPWLPCAVAFAVVGLSISTFTPASKTLVAIFAIPVAIQIADDVQLDKTAKKSIAAVTKLLDAYIEQSSPPTQ